MEKLSKMINKIGDTLYPQRRKLGDPLTPTSGGVRELTQRTDVGYRL